MFSVLETLWLLGSGGVGGSLVSNNNNVYGVPVSGDQRLIVEMDSHLGTACWRLRLCLCVCVSVSVCVRPNHLS